MLRCLRLETVSRQCDAAAFYVHGLSFVNQARKVSKTRGVGSIPYFQRKPERYAFSMIKSQAINIEPVIS
jgi:hypothetical protein